MRLFLCLSLFVCLACYPDRDPTEDESVNPPETAADAGEAQEDPVDESPDAGEEVPEELMDAVADYLDLPRIWVYEAATFYSMFETKPVGRHSISVCTNISCMLCGGDEILAHIENKLGIKVGESTPDQRIFLKPEEECLAACCGAPMMMVDHVYYEKLTTDKVDEIIDGLE